MTQSRVTDENQLPHMVAWLDEQRKLDKDQILAVQQDVQRISLSVRELTTHISKVAEDLSQSWSKLAALAPLEESLRQTKETTQILQQRAEEDHEAHEKEVILRQAEVERDHRALVDFGQQLLEIRKLVEVEDSRLRSLADEVKRSRSSIELVPGQIEGIDKSVSSVDSRVRLIEELARRQENRLTLSEKAVEGLQSDHNRMVQWQQAVEIRWNRQLSGWQQQMEEWQREAEDREKLVQQFIKQNASVKEEVQAVRLTLAEVEKHTENQAAEMLRVEGLRAHDREEVRRVEQAAEVQRRRIEEQWPRKEPRAAISISHIPPIQCFVRRGKEITRNGARSTITTTSRPPFQAKPRTAKHKRGTNV